MIQLRMGFFISSPEKKITLERIIRRQESSQRIKVIGRSGDLRSKPSCQREEARGLQCGCFPPTRHMAAGQIVERLILWSMWDSTLIMFISLCMPLRFMEAMGKE